MSPTTPEPASASPPRLPDAPIPPRTVSRRAGLLPLGIMLGAGVAVAVAIFGLEAGARGDRLACLDLSGCRATTAGDFLTSWSEETTGAAELQTGGFRVLLGIAVTLTLLLLGVIGLNLTTTALGRSTPRRREFAVRAGLGATPLRLGRGILKEAAVITCWGTGVGLCAGLAAAAAMRWSWPVGVAPWQDLGLRSTWAWIAAALLVLLLVISLLSPLSVAWAQDLRRFLTSGERTTVGPAEAVARDALAVIQVAASLVLLVGAGLLVSAFSFPAGGEGGEGGGVADTLVATVRMPAASGSGAPMRSADYERMLERVRAVPGVVDTSVATEGAWAGLGMTDRVTALCVECGIGSLPKQQSSAPARVHAVSAGFLEGTGLSLLRGRSLSPEDRMDAPAVAVISRAFAVQLFPNGEPIGKEVRVGRMDGPWYRVIGVVDDRHSQTLAGGAEPVPTLYLSILQHPPSVAGLVARTEGDAEALAPAIERAAVGAVPGAAIEDSQPLPVLLGRYRAPLRWFGLLFGVLAGAVLAFTTAGLYGLISQGVARRTREIGVRMAVGADECSILRMVLARGFRLVALGTVIGLVPLSGLARLLQLSFDGVDPWNPVLAASVMGILLGVGLMASYRPAQRAARVQPLVALRAPA